MRNERLKGLLLVTASAVCWSFSGVLGKNVTWSGLSKGGVRSIVAVFIYAMYRKTLRVRITKSTLVGALGVALTSTLYMIALTLTTSANAIVLQYSMPLYVVLLGYAIFRIKPQIKEIIAMPLLLVGIALCCMGKGKGSDLPLQTLGNVLALVSGLTFSLVFLASRMKDANPVEYTYLGICFTMLVCVWLPFDEKVRFTKDKKVKRISTDLFATIIIFGATIWLSTHSLRLRKCINPTSSDAAKRRSDNQVYRLIKKRINKL